MSIYFSPSLDQLHGPPQRPQVEVPIDRVDQPARRVPEQPRHHHRIHAPLLELAGEGPTEVVRGAVRDAGANAGFADRQVGPPALSSGGWRGSSDRLYAVVFQPSLGRGCWLDSR